MNTRTRVDMQNISARLHISLIPTKREGKLVLPGKKFENVRVAVI